MAKKGPPPYSFGLSGPIVWSLHLMIAATLLALGSLMVKEDEHLTKDDEMGWGIYLIVLGALATAYHAHLWYSNM